MAKGYKNLDVFKKSYDLSRKIYEITKEFPKDERYGMTSQLRRASVSVASNIAEGSGRRTLGEYIHQLSVSCGSGNEMEVLIDLSYDLNYIEKDVYDDVHDAQERINKMLSKLRSALEDKKELEKKKNFMK